MSKKLKAFLNLYFEESGDDDTCTFYDIKDGLTASWKHDEVSVVDVSHDGKTFHVHSDERGELLSSEEVILSLNVYKLTKVN